ncbi:MAG TPA: type II secretion system major pseudopilin GspG [Verrucomicrobiae bacterium]|nr:type II secretion system major pseudopilin GspG [Verrucomicrobiae bacterium]
MRYTIRSTAPRGFTLIEMILVIGIMAVIAGGVAYSLARTGGTFKLAQAENDIKTIENALSLYEINAQRLPTTDQGLEALVLRPATPPQPRRWAQVLEKVPLDPWKRPYQYRNPGKFNPQGYDVFSWGDDGVESVDDIGNWPTGDEAK